MRNPLSANCYNCEYGPLYFPAEKAGKRCNLGDNLSEGLVGLNKELDGIIVISLEQAVAAPYCGLLLADAGARVIKVERPEGDFARSYDSGADGSPFGGYKQSGNGREGGLMGLEDYLETKTLHGLS